MRTFEVHVEGYGNFKTKERVMFKSVNYSDAKDYLERNWSNTVYRDAKHIGEDMINIYDIVNGELIGKAWIEIGY